jgi:hypothetical protein
MHKQALIRKQVPVFVLLLLIGYIISLLVFFLLEPAPLANILGLCLITSLYCYVNPQYIKDSFSSY